MKRTTAKKKRPRGTRKKPVGINEAKFVSRRLADIATKALALFDRMDAIGYEGEIVWDGSGSWNKHLDLIGDWVAAAQKQFDKQHPPETNGSK